MSLKTALNGLTGILAGRQISKLPEFVEQVGPMFSKLNYDDLRSKLRGKGK
ncbi:MAG: hypothetical protein Q7K43_02675 [Candidatus Woesearchaeota archaeon]|nr:hypothetical protein [Candidatus Woesearchaeota archaeon]